MLTLFLILKGGKMKKKEGNHARREFLAVLSKFSAILATLGITNAILLKNASGQTPNAEPIQLLFLDAIRTGDMEPAIKKYGALAKLEQKELIALRSLTRNELAILKQIQQKLMPLGNRRITYATYY
jgi:hypothetical protein